MALRGLLSALRAGGMEPDDVIFAKAATIAIDLTEDVYTARYGEQIAALREGRVDAIYVKGAPGADLLDHRPDLVARYLAQLLKAAAWAAGHPAEVATTVAAETGGTPAGVAAAYGDGLHRALRPRLTAGLLGELTDQKDFVLSHGFLPADVDIAAWADDRPLTETRHLLDQEENSS
jgi:2'-hydroxybiphenyl-2-sulfinate desulfinase